MTSLHSQPTGPEVPSGILEFLTSHETLILATHTEPDGDCVGASLALGSYLERALGKKTVHLNMGPFERTEIIRYQSRFEQSIDIHTFGNAGSIGAVILDCTGADRVGTAASSLEGLPTAVIDHHASGAPYGDVRFVEPEVAASCFLVQLVLEAFEERTNTGISVDEAYLLMFGIATDTGFFRHLEQEGAALLAGVSRLAAIGVSPKEVHAHMFGGKSLAARRLLATILGRAKPIGDGSAILTYETRGDTQEFGRVNRDSDPLYQLILSVSGVRAAALVREENDGTCSGSLRSTDSLDVSRVAQLFGGGGHKRAAGFTASGTLAEVMERVELEMTVAMREADASL